MKRCPFYEEDVYDGIVAQVNCENPHVLMEDGSFKCPYTTEYDCDISIHLRNVEA